MDVRVDPEFQTLIPSHTPEEYQALEDSILNDGCRDPLIVWAETGILLDGHTRYGICRKHKKPHRTCLKSFASRDSAIDWCIANQLGRRNLTPQQYQYLVGQKYLRLKQPSHRPSRKTADNSKGVQLGHQKTAEILAADSHLSPTSIRRAAAFATNIDRISQSAGDQYKGKLLSGQIKASQKDVQKIAALSSAQQQRKALESIASRKSSAARPKRRPALTTDTLPAEEKAAIQSIYDTLRMLPDSPAVRHEVSLVVRPLVGRILGDQQSFPTQMEAYKAQLHAMEENLAATHQNLAEKEQELLRLRDELAARTKDCTSKCRFATERLAKDYIRVLTFLRNEIYQHQYAARKCPDSLASRILRQFALQLAYTFTANCEWLLSLHILDAAYAEEIGRFLGVVEDEILTDGIRSRIAAIRSRLVKLGFSEQLENPTAARPAAPDRTLIALINEYRAKETTHEHAAESSLA